MPNAKFNIDIVGRNRTAEALKSVQTDFAKLGKGNALGEVNKGFGQVLDRSEAFGRITRNLIGLGGGARDAAGGAAEAAGAMGEVAGALGVAATGATLVTGSLVAASLAAFKFEQSYGRAGVAVGRASQVMGESAQVIQKYQIAGEKAGVSADAMAESMRGLGNTMEDALAGRNQGALMLMQRLGMQVHRLKNGAIDTDRAMADLGRAMQGQNPQAQQLIANTLGAAGALNFLIETDKTRQAQLDDAVRSGAIRTDAQIAAETKLSQQTQRLNDAWHGLLNGLETRLVIPWLTPVLEGLVRLLGITHAIDDADLSKGLPAGGAAPGGTGKGGGLDSPRARQAMAYFEAQGWTRNQAAGIVANLGAESGFNEKAVGDHGQALGIGQWHRDRQIGFRTFSGKDLSQASFEDQLRYVQYELTSGMRAVAGGRLKDTRTAAEAGAVVSRYYEAPADVGGEADRRGQGAQHLVQLEINLRGAPAGTTAQAAASSPAVTHTVNISPSLPGTAV